MFFLVVFDAKSTQLGEKIYPGLEAYIDHNYVKEVSEEEYGRALPSVGDSSKASSSSFLGSMFKEGKAKQSLDEEALHEERLCECDDAGFFDFEEKHESKLEERMRHMSDTYSEYLMYLIRERHMENAEVWM